MADIGRLRFVEARGALWDREDTGMTQWMATLDGITEVEEALGLGIDPDSVRPEVAVTSGDSTFRADVVATTNDGRRVVIENQPEAAGLGQLLTYPE